MCIPGYRQNTDFGITCKTITEKFGQKLFRINIVVSSSTFFGIKSTYYLEAVLRKATMTAIGRVATSHINFTWEIKDFSYQCSKVGEPIASPSFSLSKTKDEKDSDSWDLLLYPYGVDVSAEGYFSLFLRWHHSERDGKVMNVAFTFSILNNYGKNMHSWGIKKFQSFLGSGQTWGLKKFISRDYVLNKKNNLLNNDVLTISSKIFIAQSNESILNEPTVELSCDIGAIFSNGICSDVTLVIGRRKIKAHKNILSARSQVFAAMFSHDMIENNENSVKIIDITYDVMMEVLKFIYTGQVENLYKMPKDLLIAADKYDLKSLKSMCEIALLKLLTIEEACEIFSIADLYDCKYLKTEAMAYIINNRKEIVKTSGFQTLSTSKPSLLRELFCKLAQ